MKVSALKEINTEQFLLIIKFRFQKRKDVTSQTSSITYCRGVA